jgi:Chromate transporter
LDPAGVTELSVVAGIRPRPAHGVSLGQALSVWLRVAALSFGGPAGQIAVMHRIIVDEQKWVGESRFLHALSYCMLLPGPEAQQLATVYRLADAPLAGRHHGRRGSSSCPASLPSWR